jgi:hypothetical protein
MALNKITYTDKVALNPQPSVADENKCTDSDLNQIKSVVNDAIDYLEQETTSTQWSNNVGQNGFNLHYKKSGNVVCLRITSNSNITLAGYAQRNIGNLPEGIRPTGNNDITYLRTGCYSRSSTAIYLQVQTNGNVVLFNWAGEITFTDGGQVAATITYII